MKEHRLGIYTLVNDFDVWGNAKDGWAVNDCSIEEENIMIDDFATGKEIVTMLKDKGYLNTNDMRKIAVEEYGTDIMIYERKGMKPLYELRRMN